MAEYDSTVYIHHIFFMHLPISGHLYCFHVLADVINMGV